MTKKNKSRVPTTQDMQAAERTLNRLDASLNRIFALHSLLEMATAGENHREDQIIAARDFLYKEAEQLSGLIAEMRGLVVVKAGAA